MQESNRILFYENGDPISPRCIRRFITSFSKSYREVVKAIIENSERLRDDKFKVFRFNIAKLMPSFKMTRKGAFHRLKVDKNGNPYDPNEVTQLCWERIGERLLKLKKYIEENSFVERRRVLVNISRRARDDVIYETSRLFDKLHGFKVKTGKISRVGASKILFAVLPEVALPVDNQEWHHVFRTSKYQKILLTMVKDIEKWERKTGEELDNQDPKPKETTLPAVYNVMAMAARPLNEQNGTRAYVSVKEQKKAMTNRSKRKKIGLYPSIEELEKLYKKGHPRGSFMGFCPWCKKPVYLRKTGPVFDEKGRAIHKKCILEQSGPQQLRRALEIAFELYEKFIRGKRELKRILPKYSVR